MEKIEWSEMSTSEIRAKQISLKEKYERNKNVITNLLDEMDELDREYARGDKEINKRIG